MASSILKLKGKKLRSEALKAKRGFTISNMTQPTEDKEREEVENKHQMAHLLAIVFVAVEQMQMVIIMSFHDCLRDLCTGRFPN